MFGCDLPFTHNASSFAHITDKCRLKLEYKKMSNIFVAVSSVIEPWHNLSTVNQCRWMELSSSVPDVIEFKVGMRWSMKELNSATPRILNNSINSTVGRRSMRPICKLCRILSARRSLLASLQLGTKATDVGQNSTAYKVVVGLWFLIFWHLHGLNGD